MANYLGYCPQCNEFVYTQWGKKKCPKCSGEIKQSRIEQMQSNGLSEDEKKELFGLPTDPNNKKLYSIKSGTFTTDWIVYPNRVQCTQDGRTFYLEKVKNLKYNNCFPGASSTIDFNYEGKAENLYYAYKFRMDALKAFEYMRENSAGYDAPKAVEKPKEIRKRCNVCGNVFCYTEKDIKDNNFNQFVSGLTGLAQISAGLSGGVLDNIAANNMANSAEKKVKDFNKCPKCNSTNLSVISEEEFNKSLQNGSNQKNNTYSEADELLKFKKLMDAGVITQEEFDAKKKQILGL